LLYNRIRVLKDFIVRNYRCFDELTLEKLGRVNLITGKNIVGKTALLEALRIYGSGASIDALWEIIASRNEHVQRETGGGLRNLSRRTNGQYLPIAIGPSTRSINIAVKDRTSIRVESNEQTLYEAPLNRLTLDFVERVPVACRMIASQGLSSEDIDVLWDMLALTDLESEITASLRLLAPSVERITLLTNRADSSRVPFVRLAGNRDPVPLKQLGDGMNRVFGIALAIANAGACLLVDEIENGIHYSVLEQIWDFIFGAAARLEVQVFATTHSWDCVTAFQRAAKKAKGEEGVLIRLERRRDRVVPTYFAEEELEIAAREQIEVR